MIGFKPCWCSVNTQWTSPIGDIMMVLFIIWGEIVWDCVWGEWWVGGSLAGGDWVGVVVVGGGGLGWGWMDLGQSWCWDLIWGGVEIVVVI